MTFIRSLILVAMSLLIMPAVANEKQDEAELVGKIAYSSPENEFLKAIKEVIANIDLNGAASADILDNRVYNRTMPAVVTIDKDLTYHYIPKRVALLTINSALCDVPQNGGCLIVEKDMDGNPTAYYLGVAYTNINTVVKWFRKEVDKEKFADQIALILKHQGVDSQVYSQVSNTEDLIRDHKYAGEPGDDKDRPDEDEDTDDDDNTTPVDPVDPSDQDAIEKAEIKNAILNGCPIVRDENGKAVMFQKRNKRTGRLIGRPYKKKICPQEAIVKKHLPIMTEVSAAEAAKLEKEAEEIFRKGNRSFKTVKSENINKGMVTCYPIAKIEVKRPRIAIGVNFMWSPTRKKPDIHGKGKLLCYKDGKMTHRINMEMKYFYGPIGAALAIPEGTHYAAGLLSIGVAESPISLLTRKLENGQLEIFREWVFVVSADLNFGVGLGANAFGFSSGKEQRPIFNIISGSARKDVLGAGLSLFDVGRIGLDPDDF